MRLGLRVISAILNKDTWSCIVIFRLLFEKLNVWRWHQAVNLTPNTLITLYFNIYQGKLVCEFTGVPGDSAISLVRKMGSTNTPSNCFNDCFTCRQQKLQPCSCSPLSLLKKKQNWASLMRLPPNCAWKLKRVKPSTTSKSNRNVLWSPCKSAQASYKLFRSPHNRIYISQCDCKIKPLFTVTPAPYILHQSCVSLKVSLPSVFVSQNSL